MSVTLSVYSREDTHTHRDTYVHTHTERDESSVEILPERGPDLFHASTVSLSALIG